jgi:hypothetical protein
MLWQGGVADQKVTFYLRIIDFCQRCFSPFWMGPFQAPKMFRDLFVEVFR